MKGDLVVVVADGGIEQAIRGLLTRPEAIGIRALRGVEYPKLKELDGGTYSRGHELASLYKATHEHALIVFDLAWEGRPSDDPELLRTTVEANLASDWGSRGRCVVIDPELEVWVWSDSPHVATELGWPNVAELRSWLAQEGLWDQGDPKPAGPKDAYLRAIREKRTPRSNASFHSLATRVSTRRCHDPSFLRLLSILRTWFAPASASPEGA